MEAYSICQELDEFLVAREQFERLVGGLRGDAMAHAEHNDVEQLIKNEGFEVLRRLFQGHLDLRANKEEMLKGVQGSDGVLRTHRKAECTRPLESLFGEVTVTRVRYGLPSHESLFPLDAELNLPLAKSSHGLLQVLGEEASKVAFDDTVETVDKLTGGHVPKRQAQDAMPGLAVDFNAFYAVKQFNTTKETDALLVMSADGKGVVMREESLREATRNAAKKARKNSAKKKSARLKPGEKPNRKRMATVTAVYSVKPYVRTPEAVMSLLQKDTEKETPNPETKRPRPTNKRVAASLEKDSQQVIIEMFAEAELRDPEHKRRWVVVVDGDGKQLRNIKNAARKFGVKVTIVLDIVHVSEYLWKASYCFHKVGSDEAQEWVSKKMLEVLRGNAGQVAGGMKRAATKLKISKDKRENINKCARYLLTKKQHMRYQNYLAKGFPIGSGVIEGACRYLVKDRMDITGARWGLDTAEAILKLRALRTSGDMEDYWNFHRQEENKRHHQSRYANTPRLEVVK